MVSLPCLGWALFPELYTPDGLNGFLAVGFFSVIPWAGIDVFWLSPGGPVYGSVHQRSYFIVFRFV